MKSTRSHRGDDKSESVRLSSHCTIVGILVQDSVAYDHVASGSYPSMPSTSTCLQSLPRSRALFAVAAGGPTSATSYIVL